MNARTTGGSCPLTYTSLRVTGSLVNVVVGPLAVPGFTYERRPAVKKPRKRHQ